MRRKAENGADMIFKDESNKDSVARSRVNLILGELRCYRSDSM